MDQWRELEEGDVFEERYRIDSILGVGGFAHVYRATQIDLGRDVALKILRPAAQMNQTDDKAIQTWIDRFRREAKVISQLRDPHTITMFDYGNTNSGISYMVFEYVSGKSLQEYIEESGPMEPARVVSILRQSLESIHEAHSLGILHRDLKPANIMVFEHLGKRDRVKVLDFGIAKPIREDNAMTGADLTQAGSILGTPRYMAPEQLKGQDVGPASDLYSLGLVAYELLSGKKAISGDTTMTVISQQLSPEPIRLPERLECPAGLRSIIEHMVTKDSATRFGDAAELLEALEHWDSEEAVIDRDSTVVLESEPADQSVENDGDTGGPPAAIPTEPQLPASSLTENDNSKTMPPVIVAAITAALVIGVGVTALLLWSGDPDDHPASAELSTGPSEQVGDDEATDDIPELAGLGEDQQVDDEPATMTIFTDPEDADILVDGVLVGSSPATISIDDITFPATISARSEDGRNTEQTIGEPTEELALFFEQVPSAEDSAQTSPSHQRESDRRRIASPPSDSTAVSSSDSTVSSTGDGQASSSTSDKPVTSESSAEETAEPARETSEPTPAKPDEDSEDSDSDFDPFNVPLD